MHLRTRLQRHARRCADERGFTMLLAPCSCSHYDAAARRRLLAVPTTPASRATTSTRSAPRGGAGRHRPYNYQLNQNPNYWETTAPTAERHRPGSTDAGSTETLHSSYSSPDRRRHRPACATRPTRSATLIEGCRGAAPAAGPSGSARPAPQHDVSRTIVAQYRSPELPQLRLLHRLRDARPLGAPGHPTDCAVHYPNRGTRLRLADQLRDR